AHENASFGAFTVNGPIRTKPNCIPWIRIDVRIPRLCARMPAQEPEHPRDVCALRPVPQPGAGAAPPQRTRNGITPHAPAIEMAAGRATVRAKQQESCSTMGKAGAADPDALSTSVRPLDLNPVILTKPNNAHRFLDRWLIHP